MSELRELRLRYHVESMADIARYIDKLKLGEMPEFFAMFLLHASDAANWHEVDDV